mgnify:CR=1 FL=1
MQEIGRLRKKSHLPEDQPTYCAAVGALLYMATAIFYILVSGQIAAMFARSLEQLRIIETFKGVAFVLVTGIVFFLVSLGLWRRTRQQRDLLMQSERRAVAAMYSATLAHDLNNLLMGLSGLVEAIKQHEKDDAFLSGMREAVENSMRGLVPFSKRIAATARDLPQGASVKVDLAAALTQITELVKKHPDVRFCTLNIDPLPSATLTLNQDLLEQALLNLLINAAQAAGQRGTIRIAARLTEHGIAIEVHDSGPGIPPDKVESIFRLGYTTKSTGSGLGLLSVQAFAASCRGRIEVERSPLGGALFRIVIPPSQEPSQTAP